MATKMPAYYFTGTMCALARGCPALVDLLFSSLNEESSTDLSFDDGDSPGSISGHEVRSE